MTLFAQFRLIFNSNPEKRFSGGFVQCALDGGFDVPFKPSKDVNYYGYKGKKLDIYDEMPRKVLTDDVVLIERKYTFCFLKLSLYWVTKQGALKNREIEKYWKQQDELDKN